MKVERIRNVLDELRDAAQSLESAADEAEIEARSARRAVDEMLGALGDDYPEPLYPEAHVIIDAHGRIYMEGVHVGWCRKGLAADELRMFCDRLGCEMPFQDDFVEIGEAPAG